MYNRLTMDRRQGGLEPHVGVDVRRFFFVSKQRANSDTMYAVRHQILDEYEPTLTSDNVRCPVEYIKIGKVKGGVGADDGDDVEG
jgi:hypothetical protein